MRKKFTNRVMEMHWPVLCGQTLRTGIVLCYSHQGFSTVLRDSSLRNVVPQGIVCVFLNLLSAELDVIPVYTSQLSVELLFI